MERSSAPEQIRPGQLILRTEGACSLDLQHLLAVFTRQRHKFAAVLAGFTPGDWAARTRCAGWSAHDVVRHLCDCNAIFGSADQRVLDVTAGFDPRTSPRQWPAILASESPDATLGRFLDTTCEMLALARSRLDRGQRYDVRLPYGPMGTGRSWRYTGSGTHGCTSVTSCSPEVASIPPTPMPPPTRLVTACSSPRPWRPCSAARCATSN